MVSGYVRGKALSVNGLLHIPDLGDFQLCQVHILSDSLSETVSDAHYTLEETDICIFVQ